MKCHPRVWQFLCLEEPLESLKCRLDLGRWIGWQFCVGTDGVGEESAFLLDLGKAMSDEYGPGTEKISALDSIVLEYKVISTASSSYIRLASKIASRTTA